MSIRPIVHRDGTVTYWSVYAQAWERHATGVPDRELAAMSVPDRDRVTQHLSVHRPVTWMFEAAHYRGY